METRKWSFTAMRKYGHDPILGFSLSMCFVLSMLSFMLVFTLWWLPYFPRTIEMPWSSLSDLFHPIVAVIQQGENDIRLSHFAVTAEGQIIGHRDNGYLAYRFARQNENYIAEQVVNGSAYNRLEDNARVTVQYLPDNPGISRLQDVGNLSDSSWTDAIVLGIGILLAYFVGLWAINSLLDYLQLDRFGAATQGSIVNSREVKGDEGSSYYVTYEYATRGVALKQEIKVSLEDYPHPTKPLSIEYLRSDPKVHRVYYPAMGDTGRYGYDAMSALLAMLPLMLTLVMYFVTGRYGLVIVLLAVFVPLSWLGLRTRLVRFTKEKQFQQEQRRDAELSYISWKRLTKPRDMWLVIDTSESMNFNGKLGKACELALSFLDKAGPQDRIGLIVFNNFVNVLFAQKYPEDNTVKLAASIKKLHAFGGTALCEAVGKAIKQSPPLKNAERTRVVVVLTDGQDSDGETPQRDTLLNLIAAARSDQNPLLVLPVVLGNVPSRSLDTIAAAAGTLVQSAESLSIDQILDRVTWELPRG
jgi:Mg-chelatase subunit ChlD